MSEHKVIIGSSKTFDHVIVPKAKLKKYKLWVDEDTINEDIIKKGIEFHSAPRGSWRPQEWILKVGLMESRKMK
jgi:hypothetical protein